ncbi:MAG: L,D-transpeptidase [Muribaculaceae bacterium]|nr:L,D-transpeptidase [Muribaculaceae bacterium]
MKRLFNYAIVACAAMMTLSCGGNSDNKDNEGKDSVQQEAQAKENRKALYTGQYSNDSTFIVISKKDLNLTVYASVNGDTLPVAEFPVCLSKVKGQKQGPGDMKTPESEPGAPFKIIQIQDASDWAHDFGDGRGSILAYGHWFLRLETPGHSGIGIHGSTNNENSVPGRASEGCIRLLDKDIITLKEKYAHVGMPVVIKQEEQGLLGYEMAK